MPVLAPATDGDSASGGGAQNDIPFGKLSKGGPVSQGLEEWGVSGTSGRAAHGQA